MHKKLRAERTAQKIKYWENPLVSQVKSRREFRKELANEIFRMRRAARQYYKDRDHEGLDDIGYVLSRMCDVFEMYFSDHEFAQLIGANYKRVENLRQKYEISGYQTPFFAFVLLNGLEQESGQPLVTALITNLRNEFAEDPVTLQRLRNALENINPEICGKYYYVVIDAEGKERREKYYPSLKVMRNRG